MIFIDLFELWIFNEAIAQIVCGPKTSNIALASGIEFILQEKGTINKTYTTITN
jgi:hypothetical protein